MRAPSHSDIHGHAATAASGHRGWTPRICGARIRTLIVEDDSAAREQLRLLLLEERDFELLNVEVCGTAALATIQRETPDLIFLEVRMPGTDGFAVLQAIPREHQPLVIFTALYSRHALRAFDVRAFDYLLKPFKPPRVLEALERVREHLALKRATLPPSGWPDAGGFAAKSPHLTRLTIKTGDRTLILKTFSIDAFESAGNYVAVHAGKESHFIRETLTSLEAQLDPEKFLRISRTAIVNLDQVKELQALFRGEHLMILQNGRKYTMTRGLRDVERILKFS